MSQVELADAEREDEYISHWNAIDEEGQLKIDKEVSFGYIREPSDEITREMKSL